MRAPALPIATALVLVLSASATLPAFAQGKPWRHGIIEPKGDAGFAMMVTKGGFAQKQAITVELPQFQNDAIALRALLAGELESFEGGPGTAIVAASKNADVKIIGCHWQTVVHSVFASGKIKTPEDLKGKTFAISAPGAMPDLVARGYLAEHHIADADVKFASMGADGDRYKALAAGVAAATVISIEFLPIAEKAGFKLLARGSDVMPKFLRLCTMTSSKVLASRKEDAIRFLTAEMQAYEYALDNEGDEIRITREVTGLKDGDPRPATIFEEAAKPSGVDPTMSIPIDKLRWMEDQLIRIGNMTGPFDVGRMVDNDIRTQALARAKINPRPHDHNPPCCKR
jgi:NitT/TauT family transport system substrate-binding protein